MKSPKGCIDQVDNNFISGWVVADKACKLELYCDDEYIGLITALTFRQDIVDAGLSDGNSGFRVNVGGYINSLSGTHKFSIKGNDKLIATKDLCVTSSENYILNPFLELDNKFSIKDTAIDVNCRIGMYLDRFVANDNLQHSNGSYTRIGFGDISPTESVLSLNFNVDSKISENIGGQCLELGLVAKSSQSCNLSICLIDNNDHCVYDAPVLLSQNWGLEKIIFTSELSERIRKSELKLQLRTKHYGKRCFDIAMLILTEDVSKFKTPVQERRNIKKTVDKSNLLNNGQLTTWTKGIDFSQLRRGQELANNWFVEMSKANQSKFQVSVHEDNKQKDSLANNFSTKFGLRARTTDLDGYARLVCPFNTSAMNVLDYELTLDIEATAFSKKAVIPQILIIARDSKDDRVVFELSRKVAVLGRQTFTFKISPYQANEILKHSIGMPVLALAITYSSNSDLTLFSASFKVTEPQETQELELIVNESNYDFSFEDASITEQLHLLKGLDSWATAKPVILVDKEPLLTNVGCILGGDEFAHKVQSLTPHKMVRPARNFPFIDIIVPVYNACDDVLLCLSSLIEKTDLVHRVIIVNDGDEQRTTDMLYAFSSAFNHVEVIDNPINIGYTKSVNKGIKHSNAEWVVVLNSDTIVSESWLGRLMNCALSSDKVGMVGPLSNAASWQSIPQIHDKDGDWHLNPLPTDLPIDTFAQMVESHSNRDYPNVGVINGFCQLINMTLLDEIGLLDEIAFPVGYGEENDMCARAVKAGFKLLIADDTYVFHAKSKSFGHEQRKKLAKEGSLALKKKHPDVDWGEVTRLFRENPALNTLRENILIELQQFENGVAQ